MCSDRANGTSLAKCGATEVVPVACRALHASGCELACAEALVREGSAEHVKRSSESTGMCFAAPVAHLPRSAIHRRPARGLPASGQAPVRGPSVITVKNGRIQSPPVVCLKNERSNPAKSEGLNGHPRAALKRLGPGRARRTAWGVR
jgi:hypothetical protein